MLLYLDDARYKELRTQLATINGYAKQFPWVNYQRRYTNIHNELQKIRDIYSILNYCLTGE